MGAVPVAQPPRRRGGGGGAIAGRLRQPRTERVGHRGMHGMGGRSSKSLWAPHRLARRGAEPPARGEDGARRGGLARALVSSSLTPGCRGLKGEAALRSGKRKSRARNASGRRQRRRIAPPTRPGALWGVTAGRARGRRGARRACGGLTMVHANDDCTKMMNSPSMGVSHPAWWFTRGRSTQAGPITLFRLRTKEPHQEMVLAPKALLWSGSVALAAPAAGALGWSAATAAMPAPGKAGHAAGSG